MCSKPELEAAVEIGVVSPELKVALMIEVQVEGGCNRQ
jgi:hypothetical protein